MHDVLGQLIGRHIVDLSERIISLFFFVFFLSFSCLRAERADLVTVSVKKERGISFLKYKGYVFVI